MGHLNELRRLWDLDIISGSTLYMRLSCVPLGLDGVHLTPSFLGTCLSFKVIIEPPGDVEQVVDAEEEETIWGLKERLSLIIGAGIANMNRHGKLFQDDKKVKDEGLVGGETLLCMRLGQDSSGITEYVVCVL
jgi:hypothetical protein